jgi:hypothetical protein
MSFLFHRREAGIEKHGWLGDLDTMPQSHGNLDRNIWICASDGDLEGVQEFIASGVDPNERDEYGYTPM